MKPIAVALLLAAALSGATVGHADPYGPGPGMCQYLGANYNVWYPCTQYQPWLPYGTGENPPYSSQRPASDCGFPNQHNVGCS